MTIGMETGTDLDQVLITRSIVRYLLQFTVYGVIDIFTTG